MKNLAHAALFLAIAVDQIRQRVEAGELPGYRSAPGTEDAYRGHISRLSCATPNDFLAAASGGHETSDPRCWTDLCCALRGVGESGEDVWRSLDHAIWAGYEAGFRGRPIQERYDSPAARVFWELGRHWAKLPSARRAVYPHMMRDGEYIEDRIDAAFAAA